MGEVERVLREALMESYPYLAEPRRVEAFVEDLISRGLSLEEAVKELEEASRCRDPARPLLATDLRILLGNLQRLLAPQGN